MGPVFGQEPVNIVQDSGRLDSSVVDVEDNLSDTTGPEYADDALDAPVTYKAADSIVYLLETVGLVIYNYVRLKIRPKLYIPLKTFTFYSMLLTVEFILVDHRVIDIYDFIDWIKSM